MAILNDLSKIRADLDSISKSQSDLVKSLKTTNETLATGLTALTDAINRLAGDEPADPIVGIKVIPGTPAPPSP